MLRETTASSRYPGRHLPGLPQTTYSLCPECLEVISATLYEEDDKVWMKKTCPIHGEFKELISSDAEFFKKLDSCPWGPKHGITKPLSSKTGTCPNDCGLCINHKSPPIFINIDLTNRCNLRCPVCFANAATSGKVCELSLEKIRELIYLPLTVSEVKPSCIQFSGGEPTIHPNFFDALRIAKEAGYAQIQIASNGILFAKDPHFAERAAEAGLNIIYLQFDGIDDKVYLKTRGRPLMELKEQAIENIKKAGMSICLVPTLIKGVNDHQIGDIFRFAIDRIDVVAGISWQPVAFTGRIDFEKRLKMRFTMADLARCLEEQTGGKVKMLRDWYPLNFVEPYSRLLEALTGEPYPAVTCHPHCGAGTYIIVDRYTKEYRTIPEFVDVEGFMKKLDNLANILANRRWFKKLTLTLAMKDLMKFYKPENALPGWDTERFTDFVRSFAEFRERYPDNEARVREVQASRYRALLLVAMHFQDVYNYELPRVQRCVIHYAAADGKLYPFCTYNCGPCFRDKVEAMYAKPFIREKIKTDHQIPVT